MGEVSASRWAIHLWERRRVLMQGPWDDDALGGLDRYEQMVNTFAENAQAY